MANKKSKKSKSPSAPKAAKAANNDTTSSGFGALSLTCGICSIVFAGLWFLGLILGMLGIIFAIIQGRIKPTKVQTAGMVTCIIGMALVVFLAMAKYWRGIA